MTIESLACPSCGSTQVKEVKAGTFFCDHCESVFKHVDPTQVTVAPAFCTCGNQIAVQCNVCRVGLCANCEATAADASWGILIEVDGYGYRLSQVVKDDRDPEAASDGGYANLSSFYRAVRQSSVVPLNPSGEYATLVLPALKLYSVLDTSQPVHHVCWDCLALGIPRLVEAMDHGTICVDPFCWNAPEAQCRCCTAHYCARGLVSAGTQPGAAILVDGESETWIDWPGGICWGCAYEGTLRMKDVIQREFPVLEVSKDVWGPPLGGESVYGSFWSIHRADGIPKYRLAGALRDPGWAGSTSRSRVRRNARERKAWERSVPATLAEVKRLAGEVQERWEKEQFDHPCDKATSLLHEIHPNPLHDNHPYGLGWRLFAYVVVDERDRATPGALPGLTVGS